MSTSINVFFNSHTQSLTNCIASCFQAVRAELSRCDRDSMACKAWSVYYLAIYRESLVGKWRMVKPQGEKENWVRHTTIVNTSWCSTEWVRVCKKHSGAGHRWSRGWESLQLRTVQSRKEGRGVYQPAPSSLGCWALTFLHFWAVFPGPSREVLGETELLRSGLASMWAKQTLSIDVS